jgi:hypothetical protein
MATPKIIALEHGDDQRRQPPRVIHRNPVEPTSTTWPRASGEDFDRTLSNYPIKHLLRHFARESCTPSTR